MAITGIDTIEGKQIIAAGAVSAKSAEMAYNDENGNPITGYQVAGDYLTTADSANFYTTANESGFITGVDLTPYQLTADMTAYQPVGEYLTTADSANFYTTANESGFISEVPAGTMNESAFEYDANDKISGYNGSAFAGGSDVPEGVMVESGLEYNAVNEISAYNGSAIAQYGAEKQWLVHDDTLVHASNSAQYALGVNLSAVAQLLGVDETVLFESTAADGTTLNTTSPITLAEDYSNFNRMRIEYRIWSDQSFKFVLEEVPCRNGYFTLSHGYINAPNNPGFYEFLYGLSGNNSKLYYSYGRFNAMGTTGLSTVNNLNIMGVTGIGRKA